MKTLLIAESSDAITEALVSALSQEWNIHICSNGHDAIYALKHLSLDALIINLCLPQEDGLTVLKSCFPNIPPVTLALSTYISPYVEDALGSLGVGYIMHIPCKANKIKERLADMYEAHLEHPNITTSHLRALGVNYSLAGYRYLAAAIPVFARDPQQHLHKEVYPIVVQACGLTDERCVESSIRTAIKVAWKHRDDAVWKQYFSTDRCPRNKDFISCLAEKISSISAK